MWSLFWRADAAACPSMNSISHDIPVNPFRKRVRLAFTAC